MTPNVRGPNGTFEPLYNSSGRRPSPERALSLFDGAIRQVISFSNPLFDLHSPLQTPLDCLERNEQNQVSSPFTWSFIPAGSDTLWPRLEGDKNDGHDMTGPIRGRG